MPIVGLDHLVVHARELDPTVADYETLFGRRPAWRGSGSGAETVFFTLANMSLAIVRAGRRGAADDAARTEEGLAGLCFRVTDMMRTSRRLSRVGLQTEPLPDAKVIPLPEAAAQYQQVWTRPEATRSIEVSFLERNGERAPSQPHLEAPVLGLDHVVIGTSDSERAAGLYGARLGLDLSLDLARPDWGVRLMFFRCGDLVVETAQRLTGQGAGEAMDRFQGLSWRVDNAEAARARLAATGFDVSDVRTGRRPGTQVFSVRNRTAGVPTIFIQLPPRTERAVAQ